MKGLVRLLLSMSCLLLFSTEISVAEVSVKATVPDTKPPVTAIVIAPDIPDGTNGWYVTAPSITLSSSEAGETYFRWDLTTGAWMVYSSPLTSPEGRHTLYYYSVDTAGNEEPRNEWVSKVDSTLPNITSTTGGIVAEIGYPVAIRAEALDNISLFSVALCYRSMGDPLFRRLEMTNMTGASYHVSIPASDIDEADIQYYVEATDSAGNAITDPVGAPIFGTYLIITDDTIVPSTPTGLAASAVGTTEIDLSWNSSTDNGKIAGYEIERSPDGKTRWTPIGRSSTNAYSDTGLSASTTYYYRIRAYDAAGNKSTYSSIASAITYPIHDVGISGMQAPQKAKVSGGKTVAQKVVIIIENYGSVPEPDATVFLYGAYPDGSDASWSQSTALDISGHGRRVEFEVTLDTSHGLGTITWTSRVVIPADSDFGGPVYTVIR